MSDHSFELQKTIFTTLNSDNTITSTYSATVHDHVPQGTSFPYIVIGEETMTDESSTKTLDFNNFTLTIHIFSRNRGRKEAKQIMARIYELLHNQNLSVTGADHINTRFEFSDVIKENDGLTYHGVQRFRTILHD
jgi:hypothetical protein|tara:strand:- start:243 stop:647 length:405 start_codon:yes stop_codon:yes gene_type:complete